MALTEKNDTFVYTDEAGNVRSAGVVKAILSDASGATNGALPAGTDRSGTITTGGTSQTLAAANPSRKSLEFQNISDIDMWITETDTVAAADTIKNWKIYPGASWSASTRNAVYLIGATTGKKFTAIET